MAGSGHSQSSLGALHPQVPEEGALVISLDFELYWGMRDVVSEESFLERAQGVRKVVLDTLDLFQEFGIEATWATVGFLAMENLEQLKDSQPHRTPSYQDSKLSNYRNFERVVSSGPESALYFAPDLIDKICKTPGQEVGTHTFCHYYVGENGQCEEEFVADVIASSKLWRDRGVQVKSIVFPRNQINEAYLGVCANNGLVAYRGNSPSAIYDADNKNHRSQFFRAMRLLDGMVNLTGHQSVDAQVENFGGRRLINIPASRFLRPCGSRVDLAAKARISRISSDLKFSAKNKKIYHLWWHPHNFGLYPDSNLQMLREILTIFSELKQEFGMKSLSMISAANRTCCVDEGHIG